MTAFILIGWICSIYWAYLILNKAYESKESVPMLGNQTSNMQNIANKNRPNFGSMDP